MVFWGCRFPQKTNKSKSTWGIIVVKSNFFVLFLEEIEDIKNPLEIIRPLCCSKIEIQISLDQIKTFFKSCKWDEEESTFQFLKGQKISKGFLMSSISSKNERRNSTSLLWYLKSTCFCSFFGGNRRHQKPFQNYLTFNKNRTLNRELKVHTF